MGFAPGPGGVVLEVSAEEERALSDLLYSVLELLAADGDGAAEDPVQQRWFPSAYPDDEAAAAEFRRFTQGDLAQAKRTAAVGALESLDTAPVDGVRHLSESAALAWLAALNDIRLAFATRIGIGAEEPEAGSEGRSPGRAEASEAVDETALAIYDWLTWLQETLVRALP
jgi:hypothetical protein